MLTQALRALSILSDPVPIDETPDRFRRSSARDRSRQHFVKITLLNDGNVARRQLLLAHASDVQLFYFATVGKVEAHVALAARKLVVLQKLFDLSVNIWLVLPDAILNPLCMSLC
jgi:hypothetical protein